MKLFKNKVGRPSNETKSLRKTFIISIVAIIISVIALFVSLISKSETLTGSLKGAASYKIQYGMYGANADDISIKSYSPSKTHKGLVKFPSAPKYLVKSNKSCAFKGWIFQKASDGRYRMLTTNNKYVWYRSSLDSKKYKIKRYVYFKPGETFKISGDVRLFAAFSCTNGNSNNKKVTAKKTTVKKATATAKKTTTKKTTTAAKKTTAKKTTTAKKQECSSVLSYSGCVFNGYKWENGRCKCD